MTLHLWPRKTIDDAAGSSAVRSHSRAVRSTLPVTAQRLSERLRAEMGDVLFVMANLARHLEVEPETALQRTNATFKRRFRSMEEQARDRGEVFAELSLEEKDELWEEAKRLEGNPSKTRRSR